MSKKTLKAFAMLEFEAIVTLMEDKVTPDGGVYADIPKQADIDNVNAATNPITRK
jgi:hypothetical protein